MSIWMSIKCGDMHMSVHVVVEKQAEKQTWSLAGILFSEFMTSPTAFSQTHTHTSNVMLQIDEDQWNTKTKTGKQVHHANVCVCVYIQSIFGGTNYHINNHNEARPRMIYCLDPVRSILRVSYVCVSSGTNTNVCKIWLMWIQLYQNSCVCPHNHYESIVASEVNYK